MRSIRATLNHYTSIYKEFLNCCFSEAMSFRVHFILLIFMDLFFYASAILTVDYLYMHVEKIGIWNREEFLFFISFMLALDHLHMTFISESFWRLSFDIRTGALDFILFKPVNTIFNIFFRHIRPASMCNLVVTWGLVIYYGRICGLSFLDWVLLPFLMLLGLTLLVSMEILISTSMFWLVESFGINFLRMQLQQLSRWPDFVYQVFSRRILTFFIPILLVGNAPVRFLFDYQDFWPLLFLFIALVVIWKITAKLWDLGLRAYESASS